MVIVVSTMGGPSRAQETAGAGNGTAKAVAILTKVAPGVGNLELALGSGISVAQHTNAIAETQSQGTDLGLVGTTLTSEGCSGAVLTADQLPQPLTADNRSGDTRASRDEIPLGPAGGLRLAVEATTTPSGRASAVGAGIEIPGFLDLSGGQSVAETRVLPDGAGREAHAVVQTSIDIAGAIELRGLRWEALHRTGAERVVEGTFEIAGANVGGLPLPLTEIEPVQDAINTALAFTGLTIELPRVEEITEPNDLVRVTPLRILFKDSPAGGAVLGPVLNASRTQREQLFTEIANSLCQAKGLALVGDIIITIGAGSGFLYIQVGGVEASSGEFVSGGAIDIPANVAPVPVDPPASGEPAPTGSGFTPAAPSVPESAGPSVQSPQPVADVGPLERVCESVHPFDWPSCSEGAAPIAGLIGLAATGLVFGLDYRRQRGALVPTDQEVPA